MNDEKKVEFTAPSDESVNTHLDDDKYEVRQVEYTEERTENGVKKIKRVKYAVKDQNVSEETHKSSHKHRHKRKKKEERPKAFLRAKDRKALVSLFMVAVFGLLLVVPFIIFLLTLLGNYFS